MNGRESIGKERKMREKNMGKKRKPSAVGEKREGKKINSLIRNGVVFLSY